ncbi:MAG: DNA/RNA nuclease SfsA [Desulfobacterales bacterium]|nr:DNA/RNA nuclease SfsA [Desulfobacterales bacterium]
MTKPTDKIFKLKWPPLYKGTLIKRYKRFLADVKLDNGEIITAHCANSGRMIECSTPGMPVYLSHHDNPKRKLKFTWELIRMPESIVGVNTLVPNRLAFGSIIAENIPELSGYENVQREKKIGTGSRLDLFLSNGNGINCYVEIKNCTLVQEKIACFPDAVTTRGLKHLVELQTLVRQGHRAVMLYVIQRMDAKMFKPADHIDPAYGRGLRKALSHGVEMIVYDTRITLKGISLRNKIPSCF